MKNIIDWKEIQNFYNNGATWRDIVAKYKISFFDISKAAKDGLFISRTTSEALAISKRVQYGRKHSPETKAKISRLRKEYLKNNPGKSSWQTKNYHKSIPCEKIKAKLRAYEIAFEDELEPLRHKGRYFSADVAFEQYGVIWEINGQQHYESDGTLKPYYQNRHNLIELEGWRVFEIPYHVAMRDGIVDELLVKTQNLSYKPNNEYKLYLKPKINNYCLDCQSEIWLESKRCRKCASVLIGLNQRRVIRPSKEVLHWMIWNYPKTEIAKTFNVKGNSIVKWAKSYKLKLENSLGYWNKVRAGLIVDYQI